MLTHQDGQFVNAPDPEVTGIEQARAVVAYEIERYAAHRRNKITDPVSPFEAASWPIKVAEAAAYRAGGAAPLLTLEAQARGCTLADLVARVEANAAALSTAEAVLAGTAGRHKDALAALPTVAEALAYNWSEGWV